MEITTLGGVSSAPDADHGFDAKTFAEFISYDVGNGEPIYWHSQGNLYRQPHGELVARLEALVSNRLVQQDDTTAQAICKTILLYRDPDTGEVLQHDDGTHIIREYPYIVARFELQGHRLIIHTEGLSGPHQGGRYGLARVSNDKVFAHRAIDSTFFYWTLFGQVDTPIGKVWFTEAYNGSTPPDVMVMNRYGTLPRFAGLGDGLVQTVARRHDSYDTLPEEIRSYVAEYAPNHQAPPKDHAEVQALRDQYLEGTPPSAPQSAPPEKLSDAKILAAVTDYFSALRAMEIDRLLELFTEDALSWDPVGTPPLLVRDKSTNYFRALSNIFLKMALTEDDVFIAGGEAAVRWQGSAILRSNPVELDFEGVSTFEFDEQGLIKAVRSYWDKAGLMSRLKG